jgi:hypothetical protein
MDFSVEVEELVKSYISNGFVKVEPGLLPSAGKRAPGAHCFFPHHLQGIV